MLGKVARNRGTWGNTDFLLGEMEKRWGEACDYFVLNLVSIPMFFPPGSQFLIKTKEIRMGSFSQKHINKTMLFGGFTEETKFTSVRQTQNNKLRETNTRKSRARHHFWMGQSMNGYRLPGEITLQQSNMDVENPADIQFIKSFPIETMISPYPGYIVKPWFHHFLFPIETIISPFPVWNKYLAWFHHIHVVCCRVHVFLWIHRSMILQLNAQ